MIEIRKSFRERSREILQYLDTLRLVENAEFVSRSGNRRLTLDATTHHVLKASVFLHLYNLVESTVTGCLSRIAEEIRDNGVAYDDLSEEWKRSWLQERGQTAKPLSQEKRIETLLDICEHLIGRKTIDFEPSMRGGGNLDDSQIEKTAKRFGIDLNIQPSLRQSVKRHVVDDMGPLKLIRQRRNELAHGEASFGDCGRNVSVRDLRNWTAVVVRYLREVIRCFEEYLHDRRFERRTIA